MNYHDLKVIHLISVIVFSLSITVTLFNPHKKFHKILSGILSIFILASGILILNRFGISTSGPYPSWVIIKFAIWTVLTVLTPIIVKRAPTKAKFLFWPWALIISLSGAMAIYKPL